ARQRRLRSGLRRTAAEARHPAAAGEPAGAEDPRRRVRAGQHGDGGRRGRRTALCRRLIATWARPGPSPRGAAEAVVSGRIAKAVGKEALPDTVLTATSGRIRCPDRSGNAANVRPLD